MATQITQYLIYVIPVVLVILAGFFLIMRSRKKATGENLAMMYSVVTKNIVEIKPFVIVHRPEGTKAVFTDEIAIRQKGVIGFFKDIMGRKQPQTELEEIPFSEMVAIRNVKANGWFAIFANENRMQLPLISGNPLFLQKIMELEKNVEKRVSRLRSAQRAIESYVNTSSPVQSYGAVQILNIVLLFVALLAIAYCISSVTSSITSLGTLLKGLHALTNST